MSKTVKLKPSFDPRKNYKWEPTDVFEFTLTGQQFASLYHLVSQGMNTPGGAPVSLLVESYEAVMGLFRGAVEEGLISEASPVADISAADDTNIKQLFKTT